MDDVFTCSVGRNVLKVDFHSNWEHTRYYQALFNATGVIAKRTFTNKDWALLLNWKHQFIMICTAFLHLVLSARLKECNNYLVTSVGKDSIV